MFVRLHGPKLIYSTASVQGYLAAHDRTMHVMPVVATHRDVMVPLTRSKEDSSDTTVPACRLR